MPIKIRKIKRTLSEVDEQAEGRHALAIPKMKFRIDFIFYFEVMGPAKEKLLKGELSIASSRKK